MKTNKSLTLSLIAAGLSVSAAGFAADSDTPARKTDSQAIFKKLDANHDGKLTAAEMTKLPDVMQQQMLARVDTNHDGRLQKNEFEARAKARADRMFARMDKNGDGTLSASEMKPPKGHHHMGPSDGDRGDAAKLSESDDPAGKPGNHNDRHHHGWHHRHHHGMPRTDEIFAHMDADNSGYVSADEWNRAAQQWHRHHGSHRTDHRSDAGSDTGSKSNDT